MSGRWVAVEPEDEKDEFTHREELVREMLRSEGWQVARDTVQQRMQRIGHRLATDVHFSLEEIRGQQAEYRVLARLLDREAAMGFFCDTEL